MFAIAENPSRKGKGPDRGPFHNVGPTGSLDRLDVRGLRALRALHNLKRHALAFGQRLVAVHADRGEVHEHIVATFTLDEAVALLVREPLNGALCQLWFLLTATTTARHRSPWPPTDDEAGSSLAQ